MTEILRSWVKDIFIIVVGLYFIEIVLPEGSMRKYIKFVLSVMVLGVVISPLVYLGDLDEILAVDGQVIRENISGGDIEERPCQSNFQQSNLETVQWIQMEEIYRGKIREQVQEILTETLTEAEILGIAVDLEERSDENAFGKVRKIVIKTVGDEYVNSIKNRVSQGIGIEEEKIRVEWEENEEKNLKEEGQEQERTSGQIQKELTQKDPVR